MKPIVVLINDISKFNDDYFFQSQFNLAKDYRKNKINCLKNREDKNRSLAVEYAFRKALECAGFNYDNEEVLIDDNGKPFLKSNNAYFNCSHSGTKVICVISDCPVGCDIEEISKAKMDVAKRFFTKNEYYQISNSNSDIFYKIWCLKESFIKCIGLGLKIPLNSFEINIENGTIKLQQSINDKHYCFYTTKIDNYSLAICIEGNEIDFEDIKIYNL